MGFWTLSRAHRKNGRVEPTLHAHRPRSPSRSLTNGACTRDSTTSCARGNPKKSFLRAHLMKIEPNQIPTITCPDVYVNISGNGRTTQYAFCSRQILSKCRLGGFLTALAVASNSESWMEKSRQTCICLFDSHQSRLKYNSQEWV